jgi:2-hydroxychromene-2-carboxylate isomerase
MSIVWYYDFISPFAWLQWPKIKALASEQPVTLRPILFAGILDLCGQKGPAEIPAKREFTYRYTLWRAREAGVPLHFPPSHPFNPLAALRLCIGRAGDSIEALAPVADALGIDDPAKAIADPAVKAQLRENFDAAVAEGVFGVPTLSLDGRLFWGDDAHAFALACLRDPSLWNEPEMQRVASLPVGAARQA